MTKVEALQAEYREHFDAKPHRNAREAVKAWESRRLELRSEIEARMSERRYQVAKVEAADGRTWAIFDMTGDEHVEAGIHDRHVFKWAAEQHANAMENLHRSYQAEAERLERQAAPSEDHARRVNVTAAATGYTEVELGRPGAEGWREVSHEGAYIGGSRCLSGGTFQIMRANGDTEEFLTEQDGLRRLLNTAEREVNTAVEVPSTEYPSLWEINTRVAGVDPNAGQARYGSILAGDSARAAADAESADLLAEAAEDEAPPAELDYHQRLDGSLVDCLVSIGEQTSRALEIDRSDEDATERMFRYLDAIGRLHRHAERLTQEIAELS